MSRTDESKRFSVQYRLLSSSLRTARDFAERISIEQTVEVPIEVVPDGYVRDNILGRVISVEQVGDNAYDAVISYSDDDVGGDFLQFLSIVLGNSSMYSGVLVTLIQLSPCVSSICSRPKFGVAGLRDLVRLSGGPLLMSATKPVGLSVEELAALAYNFAMGGMDFIKDDHGIVNQSSSPFRERVIASVEAVAAANAMTGRNAQYVPNITGNVTTLLERAMDAQELGAGGLMVAPALLGFGAVHALSQHRELKVPLFSHPTFSGMNVVGQTGFSHGVYYGFLQRIIGMDAAIFPNFGGRFGFSQQACAQIARACNESLAGFAPILPTPGGGMTLDRVQDTRKTYGDDVMLLMGGALLKDKAGLVEACQTLSKAVGR
ncbi:RuBisCO large subunit C-terminal-like domain-containing protein [Mesorhizobium sp. M1403]|uniref:RuBisCO large subunit C-terminal-like domain-containing protein n=1 Tax=Mesorhizobium sp. M1403 TaxID=2957097 RepID=UPI00333CB779